MKANVMMVALFLSSALAVASSEPSPPGDLAYEMALVPVLDARSAQPKYVFLVGNFAFFGFDGLKEVVTHLKPGSTLTWNPGCDHESDEPELFPDEVKIRAFEAYCAKHGVKFVLVPAG